MQLKDAILLIVDDEVMLREYLGRWFEREGSTVLKAGNGEEALALLADRQVDLIVSDIRMPVMDGVSMLKALRASGRSRPSVIFVSGFNDYPERELFDLGAEALLAKPFDRTHLMEAAAKSLAERDDLWRIPVVAAAQRTISAKFGSLRGALAAGQIAFGRGGLSLATQEVLALGVVELDLHFREDGYVLSGIGLVRWMEPKEMQAGIEFLYLAEDSRARVVAMAEGCGRFIPGMVAA